MHTPEQRGYKLNGKNITSKNTEAKDHIVLGMKNPVTDQTSV